MGDGLAGNWGEKDKWLMRFAPILLCWTVLCLAAEPARKLKVFILAGQSNMQGQAVADLAGGNYNEGKGTLVDVMSKPEAGARYAHLKQPDGSWTVRNDVWVRYQREGQPLQAGPLSLGFGAYASKHHFGPEYQFGHVVGQAYRDQVLLIKTAWGGKSLYRDFRPPSAGGEVGPYYTKMVAEVREALANLKKDFPAYDGAEVELAGFVWYQGWNDGVNPKTAVPEYEQNLAHLIHDVRKEFGAPKLPVIVGELTGPWVDAPKEWTALRKAQANVAEYPEFKDNVVFVPTRTFVRKPEDSPNPGHGHHEFGNAETCFLVGDAFGKAAVQMAGRDRQVRQVRGWTLRIDERLVAKDAASVEKAVVILDAQLAKVERLIPAKAVERLRSVPLNFSLPYPDRRPTAEYHGGLAWVKQVGREIALAKAIEFTNIDRFEPENRRMPVLVLHELAHAYHDQVIPGGYQNKDILGVFQQAKAAGTYDAVKRWTGEKFVEKPSKAYAMTNQMEYFAEVTEAYFDRNDMEPFDRAELRAKDPGVVPILEKVWGLRGK
jgi:hypothetical protein